MAKTTKTPPVVYVAFRAALIRRFFLLTCIRPFATFRITDRWGNDRESISTATLDGALLAEETFARYRLDTSSGIRLSDLMERRMFFVGSSGFGSSAISRNAADCATVSPLYSPPDSFSRRCERSPFEDIVLPETLPDIPMGFRRWGLSSIIIRRCVTSLVANYPTGRCMRRAKLPIL